MNLCGLHSLPTRRLEEQLKCGALNSWSFVAFALNVFNNWNRAISSVNDKLKTMSYTYKTWVRESEVKKTQINLTVDRRQSYPFKGKWYTTYMWHLFLTSKILHFPLKLSSTQAEFREVVLSEICVGHRVRCLLFLSYFNHSWNEPTEFSKNSKNKIS